MIKISNRVKEITKKFENSYSVEIFEAGIWFRCTIVPKSLKGALEFASEMANDIGEERVRILLNGQVVI